MPFCPAADVCENVESSLPHSALHSICGSSTTYEIQHNKIQHRRHHDIQHLPDEPYPPPAPQHNIRLLVLNKRCIREQQHPRRGTASSAALPSSSKNGSRYGVTLYPVRAHARPPAKAAVQIQDLHQQQNVQPRVHRPFLKLCSAIEKQAKTLPIFKSPSAQARK